MGLFKLCRKAAEFVDSGVSLQLRAAQELGGKRSVELPSTAEGQNGTASSRGDTRESVQKHFRGERNQNPAPSVIHLPDSSGEIAEDYKRPEFTSVDQRSQTSVYSTRSSESMRSLVNQLRESQAVTTAEVQKPKPAERSWVAVKSHETFIRAPEPRRRPARSSGYFSR